MGRVVKRIERDEKIFFACSHLKFKLFNFWEIFLQRNQSDFFRESREHFTRIKKVSQNGCPTGLAGLREDLLHYIIFIMHYILKTRITELQTSFLLRQSFAGTLRKCFLLRYLSLTKNSVSDRRKV